METELICAFKLCQNAYVAEFWVGAATACAAIAAVGIAWYQLAMARREEAVRETFKIIEFETSPEWTEVYHRYLALLDQSTSSGQSLLEIIKSDPSKVSLVRSLLDRREYVATMINAGGADLRTYLHWYKRGLQTEWMFFAPYILTRRAQTNDATLYFSFEELVRSALGYRRRKLFG